MEADAPALFRAYPDLTGRIPRTPFVTAPTPVCPLHLEGFPPELVFLKRDERSCHLYGGNKPRKLEFAIGAALARGSKRLVTTGALGTHHGLATTILGAAVGLRTTLVLVHQPVTEEVRESLRLDAAHGAELLYAGSLPGAVAQTLRALARSSWRGERPTLIPTGGSSRRGNLGFVSAGLELAAQVRTGELPEPREIFLPIGSGGSAAGLVLGLRLAGLRTTLFGVVVTDLLAPNPRSLARSARATLRLLQRQCRAFPNPQIGPEDFQLIHDQLGRGYGYTTAAAQEALALAAERGIHLEITYGAKCLAALRARLDRPGAPNGPILFWNTYNAIDLDLPRDGRDATALPPPLQKILDRSS